MAQQVQELIDKIKAEGIATAEKKATEIEAQAQAQAGEIISKARKEAQRLIDKAKEDAQKTEQSTQEALKQSSRDMLLSLRKEIEKILQRIVSEDIKESLTSENLSDVIARVIEGFLSKKGAESDLKVMLGADDFNKLKKGILAKIQNRLKDGIEITPAEDIGKGFTISFDGGKSSFDFTDSSLADFLSAHLNEEISQLLKDAVRS